MGVNTMAFRLPQHGTFFAADADCAPITKALPWPLAERWLRLVAASGTPLFLSHTREALGPEQKAAVREAFALAAVPQPPAEPLDWLEHDLPAALAPRRPRGRASSGRARAGSRSPEIRPRAGAVVARDGQRRAVALAGRVQAVVAARAERWKTGRRR